MKDQFYKKMIFAKIKKENQYNNVQWIGLMELKDEKGYLLINYGKLSDYSYDDWFFRKEDAFAAAYERFKVNSKDWNSYEEIYEMGFTRFDYKNS